MGMVLCRHLSRWGAAGCALQEGGACQLWCTLLEQEQVRQVTAVLTYYMLSLSLDGRKCYMPDVTAVSTRTNKVDANVFGGPGPPTNMVYPTAVAPPTPPSHVTHGAIPVRRNSYPARRSSASRLQTCTRAPLTPLLGLNSQRLHGPFRVHSPHPSSPALTLLAGVVAHEPIAGGGRHRVQPSADALAPDLQPVEDGSGNKACGRGTS